MIGIPPRGAEAIRQTRVWLLGLVGLLGLTVVGRAEDVMPPARIAGRVTWEDDRPATAASVTLHRMSRPRNRWLPAERTATVDRDGRFAWDDLPDGEHWCVTVREAGAGLVLRELNVDAGETADVAVTLRPAITAWVTVRDDQGRPLAGAKWRRFDIVDGVAQGWCLLRGCEEGLGLPVAVSDEHGRLPLPPLPQGAILTTGRIDHPDYAAAELGRRPVTPGEMAACTLKTGLRLRLNFVELDGVTPARDLSEVIVTLAHENIYDANTVVLPYAVIDGRVEFVIEAGMYIMFRVQAEPFIITPQVNTFLTNKPLRISPGEHDEWTLRVGVGRKVAVRGRVVDEQGQPIVGAGLWGETQNLLADGTPAPRDWGQWCQTDGTETDARGEYVLHLSPGRGRINYRGKGVPEVDTLPVTVDSLSEQRVPDLVVKPLPKIRGVVRRGDGRPASNAVVRLYSDSDVREDLLPILTDADGAFEFSLPWLPVKWGSEERLYEHRVIAYSPHEPLGGMATIDLRDAAACGTVAIPLTPQAVDWPLSAMREAWTPWERSEPGELPEPPPNAIAVGEPVPELDGALWLNADKRSLADFRGQYVFLDFYTTWCGPCAFDFPTVKAVYDLYRDHGVAVIGVHDNSSPHEVIREHAREKGMEMPIVVDHPDGRLLTAYREAGLVRGYPSYVLIDPEGRLVTADRSVPGPSLRIHKLERVRQLLLERNGQ